MDIEIKSSIKKYLVHIKNQSIKNIDSLVDQHRQYIVISEDGIPNQYYQTLKEKLNCNRVMFKQGESQKNVQTYLEIIQKLDELKTDKSICLIALGGGVVTDLTGFIAATYFRGIDYISIPTTLLAQIDASIGGKTGINHLENKNMLGQIYPPLKVIIDPQTLNTLSNRHLNNGIAEMIKYGLIGSKDILKTLENDDWINHMDKLIYQSIKIKKTYVEHDEYDQSIRHILNFGHTIGHALESYYQYNKYLHGEAIAIGMVMMVKSTSIRKTLIQLLKRFNLPTGDGVDLQKLLPFMLKDKKRQTNHIDLICLKEIEKPYIEPVHIENLLQFIMEGDRL